MIYLDHAATSYPKPAGVHDAMLRYLREAGNPGRSGHRLAVFGEQEIWSARAAVAAMTGVTDPSRVVFTGNATMGLNMALSGLLLPGDRVLTSSFEHNSVVRPLHALGKLGVRCTTIKAAADSPIDLGRLEGELRAGGVRLVVIGHASNVTGAVMPLAEIKALTAVYGATLVVDAAQTAGHIPLSMADADVIACAGHKGLYGPQGTGVLIVGEGVTLRPMLQGGTGGRSESPEQPRWLPYALEAGTPNGVGIAGLGAGVMHVTERGIETIGAREAELRRRFVTAAEAMGHVRLYDWPSSSPPVGVVSIVVDGLTAADGAAILEERHDILVRGGLHCAPSAHDALGTLPDGTIRFSFSDGNTESDVDAAIEAVATLSKKGRSRE